MSSPWFRYLAAGAILSLAAAMLCYWLIWTNSELFGRLKDRLHGQREARVMLFDWPEFDAEPWDVSREIHLLEKDGFTLDVGDLNELTYVQCGEYRLPVGDNVLLHGHMLLGPTLRLDLTIDAECRLLKCVAHQVLSRRALKTLRNSPSEQ